MVNTLNHSTLVLIKYRLTVLQQPDRRQSSYLHLYLLRMYSTAVTLGLVSHCHGNCETSSHDCLGVTVHIFLDNLY